MREACDHPVPTVDVIIELDAGASIVLVERRFEPLGWALPGGFVDRGERVPDAARREVLEETGLEVHLLLLLGVYSDPARDPRLHTMSCVYVGRGEGKPRGGDDARVARAFPLEALPSPLCFDHGAILADYLVWRREGRLPRP